MPILRVNVVTGATGDVAGFDKAVLTASGIAVADLTDFTDDSLSGVELSVTTPFASATSNLSLTNQAHHGVPELAWDTLNFSRSGDLDPAAVLVLSGSGLVPGNSYLCKLAGLWNADNDVSFDVNGQSAVYDNTSVATPLTPSAPVEITAVATDDGGGNGVLTVTVDYAAGSTRNYFSWITIEDAALATPTVNDIDTDNEVNQYQQNAVISLTDFTETITSVTLGAVTCPIQSQVVGTSVTVDIPCSLATGSYDLLVSGATETATLSGVSYTQTHEYTAPYGLVDSNSLFTGIVLTENSYFRFVSDFANGTLDKATAESSSLWGNDIDDIYTPDGGFTGDDTAQIELLYDDGTTSATVEVTITVSAADDWPFGKGISYAAPKTWTWGSRHPKTGMRVRIFK